MGPKYTGKRCVLHHLLITVLNKLMFQCFLKSSIFEILLMRTPLPLYLLTVRFISISVNYAPRVEVLEVGSKLPMHDSVSFILPFNKNSRLRTI